MPNLPATPLTDLILSGAAPDTRAMVDAELRARYYTEAAELLRQHDVNQWYDSRDRGVASEALDAARTGLEG